MKYFIVTVLSKGKKTDYGIYAENKNEAQTTAKLKYSGMALKAVESSPPLEDQLRKLKETILANMSKKKLNQDSLVASISQLAVMVNAGLSLNESLGDIAEATDDMGLKKVLGTMAEDINAGHSLSSSAEKFRFELGNLTLAMIELGEKTGNMAEALYKLADMLEEIRRNITKFKKAMAYPRNVMIAMAGAFTVLISYVVPQFKEIFAQLGAELPVPTLILLFLEHLFNTYGKYLLLGIFIFVYVFKYALNHSREFRYKFHQFLLKLMLIKNVIMYSTLSRFTLVFAELVRAGIPVAEALDTSINMIDNLPLKDKLSIIRATVEKGGALHTGIKETGLFENMIVQMISAGEAGGQLDAMLEKVMEYYKMKFDAIIDGLSEAIEPIMLALIAGMVVLLALGIFLPMWSIGDAANGRKS